MKALALSLLFTSFTVCADETDTRQHNAKMSFISNVLVVKVGNTPQEAIKALGAPIKKQVTKAENKYYNVTDEIHELQYEGGIFKFYVPSPNIPVHGFPVSFIINSDAYSIKHSLNIGTTREAVTQTLGEPTEQKDGVYVYHNETDTNDVIKIHFINNKISKIAWYFYTG